MQELKHFESGINSNKKYRSLHVLGSWVLPVLGVINIAMKHIVRTCLILTTDAATPQITVALRYWADRDSLTRHTSIYVLF